MLYTIDDICKIYAYGNVGKTWDGEGITAKEFIKILQECDGKPVDIHINSGGGDVFEAHAIYNAIKSYSGKTFVYIDGLAASAASYLGLGADLIKMAPNALFMIHRASMFTYGNANELRDSAETLEKLDETLVGIYQAKTGLEKDELTEMLDAETWLNADEALEMGFVDELDERPSQATAFIDKQIMAAWTKTPETASQFIKADTPAQPVIDTPVKEETPEPEPVEGLAEETESQEAQAQERQTVILATGIYTI